jgi:hypothetical protein
MHGKGAASRFEFGTVTLIPDERLVLKDGRPVPFTPKAFDLSPSWPHTRADCSRRSS